MTKIRKRKRLQYLFLLTGVPVLIFLAANALFFRHLSFPEFSGQSFFRFETLGFLVLFSVTSFWNIESARYGTVHMATPLAYGVLLCFGSPAAVFFSAAALAIKAAALKMAGKKLLSGVYKESLYYLLSLCPVCLIYALFAGASYDLSKPAALPQTVLLTAAAFCGSTLYFKLTALDRIFFLGYPGKYFRTWPAHHWKADLFMQIPLALMVAALIKLSPWLLFLLTPVYFIYSALKSKAAAAKEIKTAMEDIAAAISEEPGEPNRTLSVSKICSQSARALLFDDEDLTHTVSAAKFHKIMPQPAAQDPQRRLREKSIREILCAQEEHFDGSGKPEGLKGTEIPKGARLLALAKAWCAGEDRETLEKSGRYDPQMLEAVKRVTEKEQ